MLVPKNIFPISKVAARSPSRYAIEGVYLQRQDNGRPIAVATDGRRLVAATWAEDPHEEYPDMGLDLTPKPGFHAIIATPDWNELGKKVPKKSFRPNLKNAAICEEMPLGGVINVAATDLSKKHKAQADILTGDFPKYRQVIPRHESLSVTGDSKATGRVVIGVNPKYLAETAQVVAECAGTEDDQVIYISVPLDGSRPLLVSARSPNAEALGVVMPAGIPDEARFGIPGDNADSCASGGAETEEHSESETAEIAPHSAPDRKPDPIAAEVTGVDRAMQSAGEAADETHNNFDPESDEELDRLFHAQVEHVADDPAEVRESDVDRLMTAAHQGINGDFETFRAWLASRTPPPVAAAIRDWMPTAEPIEPDADPEAEDDHVCDDDCRSNGCPPSARLDGIAMANASHSDEAALHAKLEQAIAMLEDLRRDTAQLKAENAQLRRRPFANRLRRYS